MCLFFSIQIFLWLLKSHLRYQKKCKNKIIRYFSSQQIITQVLKLLRFEKKQKVFRYYKKLLLLFLQRALNITIPSNNLVPLIKTIKN